MKITKKLATKLHDGTRKDRRQEVEKMGRNKKKKKRRGQAKQCTMGKKRSRLYTPISSFHKAGLFFMNSVII